MSKVEDADYFSVRADEEHTLSLNSQDERVAAAHAEMAQRYEQLASQFRGERPRFHIVGDGEAAR